MIMHEEGTMESVSRIAHSREPMHSASTRTGITARPEKTYGGGMATRAAAGEDFADVFTHVEEGSGSGEVTGATESSGSDPSSFRAKAEGTGLMAVLEKLAARSALRPEVRGLQNAAERIRENMERQGLTVPLLPVDEDVYPIVSPGTGNEPVEEIQAIAESAEEEAYDPIPLAPMASSDGSPALTEDPVAIIAENQTVFFNEEG